MKRRAFVFAMTLAPAMALAETPKRGLAWNKTGLPLVFPLHVRSLPGHDYFLTLFSAETGDDSIAAHFGGGPLFRVLCPPGRYWITIARGQNWVSEHRLFGPATETVQLPQPLEFKTRGLRTRQGWLLDLRDFNRPSLEV